MTPAERKVRRAEYNRRNYDKRRKVHMGPRAPLCRENGPIGALVTCKKCIAIDKARKRGSALNEWEQKRIEKLARDVDRERVRAWRRANLEKARASAKRWREKNADLHRLAAKEWREKNRDRCRENWRRWAAANPGYWRRPKQQVQV